MSFVFLMISNLITQPPMVNEFSKKHVFTVLFLTLFIKANFSINLAAQPGTLDNSFGTNGIVTTSLDTFIDVGHTMVIQEDGKILVGGSTYNSYTTADFALLRYNTNGTLDNTFGTNGHVKTTIESRSQGYSIGLQNDGKILLGGSSNFFINIARYHIDGSLDTTFGNGGTVITDVDGYYSETCKSVVIQDDGKILVGGYGHHFNNDNPYFMVLRYLENGTLDNTFGTNGVAIGNVGRAESMQIQNDGKIVIGGSTAQFFALERYDSNGMLDATFGLNGQSITLFSNGNANANSNAHSMSLQADGKIILGGFSTGNSTKIALARYLTNGILDYTFGINGILVTPFGGSSKGNALKIQDDGKIIVGGNSGDNASAVNFALVRYYTDGTLDNTFGIDGKTLTPIGNSYSSGQALDLDANGKIVLAGYAYIDSNLNFALARYHGDLTIGLDEAGINKYISTMYPNPFRASTTIHVNTPVENAELMVYNANGDMVIQKNGITGQDIQFNRDHLPQGIYFFQLIENNKMITSGKWIIKD